MTNTQNSLYSEIVNIEKRAVPAVIVTVVESKGSSPQKAGSRMIVYSDGKTSGTVGGGAIEKEAIQQALMLINSNNAVLKAYTLEADVKMKCGGNMTLFYEPLNPLKPLYIFGGGHIAHALSRILQGAGFSITITDNRPEFANAERFPNVSNIICDDYHKALQTLTFSDQSYIIIVTHGHQHDQEILEYCVQQPFAYLGMIGSKNKVKDTKKHLLNKGINENQIDRIYSPIGLKIGGDSTAEIAVSIAAQIIAVKNNKQIS